MKLAKRLSVLGLGLIAIALNAGSAAAIPFGTETVYKVSNEGIDNIIVSGTANSAVALMYEGQEKTSARIAGPCGEVRISSTTGQYTGLKVDDVVIDTSTLATETLPRCVGGSFEQPRTSNFKLPTGQVIVVGKTAGAAVKVMIPGDTVRQVTLNPCGFTTIRPTSTSPLPTTFKVGTTQYTTASLPSAPAGVPLCRNNNGVYTGYTPASW